MPNWMAPFFALGLLAGAVGLLILLYRAVNRRTSFSWRIKETYKDEFPDDD